MQGDFVNLLAEDVDIATFFRRGLSLIGSWG
jgi:hypothetical protein